MIKSTRKERKEVKPYQKTKMSKILPKANNRNPKNKFHCKQKKLRISQNRNKRKKEVNSRNSKRKNKGKALKTKK